MYIMEIQCEAGYVVVSCDTNSGSAYFTEVLTLKLLVTGYEQTKYIKKYYYINENGLLKLGFKAIIYFLL